MSEVVRVTERDTVVVTEEDGTTVVTVKTPGPQGPPGSSAIPDASTTVKGAVQLAGDLSGTATNPTVPSLANKQDKEPGKGLSTNDYTTVEKTKLAGIASGATQNASDAALRDRTTHTGSQAIGTVTGLQTALDSKLESDDVADFETTTELNARDSANRSRSNHTGTQAISTVSGLQTALDSKATPADVSTAVAGLVDAAPGTLDTLNELAAALGDDPNFAATVTTQIGTKADASALTSHTSNTSNPHSVTKAQVGLGNADNTSDANKPISTATQTALNAKVAKAGDTMTGALEIDNTTSPAPGLKLYSDNSATSGNGYLLDLHLDNPLYGSATVDLDMGAAQIVNDSPQTGLHIVQRTELAHHQNAVSVESLGATQQTLASQGLVTIKDSSTSSTNDVVEIVNNGIGDAIYINQNGNGVAFNVQTDSSTAAGVYVQGTAAFTAVNGLMRAILPSGASGSVLRLDNGGSGNGLRLVNTGSGVGLNILQSGTDEALRIENSAANSTVIESYVSKADFSGTGFNTAHRFGITGATATGQNAEFHNTGTGRNIFINQDGNGIALEIDSEATTQSSIYVDAGTAFTSAFGAERIIVGAGSSGRALRIEQNGSGDGQLLVQGGTGKALYIDDNNIGRAIDIDHDANSASAIASIWVNTANAGAGASYAAIFEAGSVGVGTTTPTSLLHINGSLALPIATKTSSYTATINDHTILCDATSGNITITLPAVSSISGRLYVIKKTDASANTVTIDGNSSETIDGATTLVLTTQWETKTIQSNGSAWFVV